MPLDEKFLVNFAERPYDTVGRSVRPVRRFS